MSKNIKTEYVKKSVIENKLLAALNDNSKVACLFEKQDLDDIIAALSGYEIGERKGNVLTWKAYTQRRKSLADDLRQLRDKVFPVEVEK